VPRRGHAVETIRVDTRKLDSLANVAGEMVVNLLKFEAIAASVRGLLGTMKQHVRIWQQLRDEISTALGTSLAGARTGETTLLDDTVERCDETGKVVLGELERLRQRLNEDITRVATSTRKLEEDVLSIRMHPVSTLFNTFPRAVRDIARELGKSVNLVVQGSETELDRKILEAIRDPLLHLVRNAVYHGIEPPAERASQGKPPEGIVRLSAWQQGDQVFIQVTDDGRGIDAVGVRRVAVAKGLIALSTADALSREDSLRLIFEPGLSTSPTVNDISGRGVGMDVVKASVEEMHGEVRVESQVGSGTAVTVVLPLTLAISRALLVRSSAQTYAVPTTSVETTTRARRGDVKSVEGKEVILVRGTAVPIVPLARVLGADSQPRSSTSETVRIVVISHSQHRFGFVVDELIGEQEIVVKPLGAPLRRVKNVAGAAILGSGEVVTVLHVPDIVAAARASVLKQAMGSRRRELVTRKRKRILVVEDSLTARELERHMLEAGGYEVETAVDGVEAMAKLAQQRVDLIVTDVQMPRMNGFEFTTRVRADERLRTIPVIIVTTRGDEADRQRGMEVGADAYLIKASLTPAELLDCARRLAG
jgi:two-component system chemotaxis sensor kinase CheA